MSKEDSNRKAPLTLETIAAIAAENMLRDGLHVPTLIVDASENNLIFTFDSLASTSEQRATQFFLCGIRVAQTEEIGFTNQVFFISEAWMTRQNQNQPFVQPSEARDRMEILMISSMNARTRKIGLMIFELVRDSTNSLREIRPLENSEGEDFEGNSPLLSAFLNGIEAGRRAT